jgi:hypothetical protein
VGLNIYYCGRSFQNSHKNVSTVLKWECIAEKQILFSSLTHLKSVLRRIFGPKRDEVTGGWRKLHNEELHGLYSSPSIVRATKQGG